MRYRFKGLTRSTGQVLEGHVEGFDKEHAMEVLSENGIVTETLHEDRVPLPPSTPRVPVKGKGANTAIDHALNNSSDLVPFDKLIGRYRGKSVWVIDRDKIRHNVSEIVDAAIAESAALAENEGATRARVAHAIDGLFGDTRNIASQVNATMERQLLRMERLVVKAEAALAAAAANGPVGWVRDGGGNGSRRTRLLEKRTEQSAVLLAILKDNLRLRGIELDAPTESGNGESAVEPPSTSNAA